MKIINTKSNQCFNARCPQIRDAQWVCQTVKAAFPHFSPSKHKPMVTDMFFKTFPEAQAISTPLTMNELCGLLDKKLGTKAWASTKKDTLQILNNYNRQTLKLDNNRANYPMGINYVLDCTLDSLKRLKLGVCSEDAIMAEFILKLNGIKSAKFASLTDRYGKLLDHDVCLFNKDDSYLMHPNKKTIVVDPWAGKADFVDNMTSFYKNQMQKYFKIPSDGKIQFQVNSAVTLSPKDLEDYRKQYPQLIFSERVRKFMT